MTTNTLLSHRSYVLVFLAVFLVGLGVGAMNAEPTEAGTDMPGILCGPGDGDDPIAYATVFSMPVATAQAALNLDLPSTVPSGYQGHLTQVDSWPGLGISALTAYGPQLQGTNEYDGVTIEQMSPAVATAFPVDLGALDPDTDLAWPIPSTGVGTGGVIIISTTDTNVVTADLLDMACTMSTFPDPGSDC